MIDNWIHNGHTKLNLFSVLGEQMKSLCSKQSKFNGICRLFVVTNSQLTTKTYNFDIKCQNISESYDHHGFYGTKFRGGQNVLFTLGGFEQ